MLKLKFKQIASSILALSMIMSMTACGNKDEPTTNSSTPSTASKTDTSSDAPADPNSRIPEDQWVKLEYLSPGTGIYEEDKSLVTREIAARTGVFVQQVTVPEDKYTVLMASGSFETDMVTIRNVNVKEAIEGNLLMAADELYEKYGTNMKKYAEVAVEHNKKYMSNDTGKLYIIPAHVDRTIEDAATQRQFYVGPFMRWDYYEELGFPQITNEDELLAVLRQMQDKHPKSADGKKTYAISRPTGDDSLWMYGCMYMYTHGQESVNNWFVTQGQDNAIIGNILEEDYVFWQSLKFYNKAHRLGIFDPESFTQKWANAEEKAKNGQMFFEEYGGSGLNKAISEATGNENSGFELIATAFPEFRNENGAISPNGWGGGYNIASSCKNPEAAMKYIDFMFSPEGARLRYSGIEGTHWNYDANKVPVPTDNVLKNMGDVEWDKVNGIGRYTNYVGLGNGVRAEDGFAVDLFTTEAVSIMKNTPLDTKYSKQFGVTYPGAAPYKLLEEGKAKTSTWDSSVVGYMATRPDDITRIMTKGYDYVQKLIPRAIMAKDDAEFDSIIIDAIKTLKGYGTDQLVKWTMDEHAKAKAIALS